MSALLGGSLDIAVSNSLQLLQAHSHNVPIVILVPGGIHDSRFPTTKLAVANDSPIVNPRELNGKIVGGATVGTAMIISARSPGAARSSFGPPSGGPPPQ